MPWANTVGIDACLSLQGAHDRSMRLASWAVAMVLMAGCTSDTDAPVGSRSIPTATKDPAAQWRSTADRVGADFRQGSASIQPRLDHPRVTELGITVCKFISRRYVDDATLIADIRKAAEAANIARLTAEEAAAFARLSNERICPDVAP